MTMVGISIECDFFTDELKGEHFEACVTQIIEVDSSGFWQLHILLEFGFV